MFFREVAGPANAPTLMLLHGWTATADLNFFTCYHALGEHFRVIAPDQRGHGRGIRSNKPFTLAACADDAAALADQLGIATFIPVGYSMGGTVAQLLWKRHEPRVRALVLAATSGYFASTRQERLSFLGLHGLGALARITPSSARERITERVYLQRKVSNWEPWAAAQLQQHDWRTILEAGGALGSFNSRDWIRTVEAPSSPTGAMSTRSNSPPSWTARPSSPHSATSRLDPRPTTRTGTSRPVATCRATAAATAQRLKELLWRWGALSRPRLGSSDPIREDASHHVGDFLDISIAHRDDPWAASGLHFHLAIFLIDHVDQLFDEVQV